MSYIFLAWARKLSFLLCSRNTQGKILSHRKFVGTLLRFVLAVKNFISFEYENILNANLFFIFYLRHILKNLKSFHSGERNAQIYANM